MPRSECSKTAKSRTPSALNPAARGGNLLIIEPPGPLAIPRPPKDCPWHPIYSPTPSWAELLLPRVLDDATH